MKRLKPNQRKAWAVTHVTNLKNRLLCMYGGWNQQKLLDELERELRKGRQNGR